VGTLALPARMSPCLRLFIEMLFEEVDAKHGTSWHLNRGSHSAISNAIQTREALTKIEPVSFRSVSHSLVRIP
jgi:hypothetical protein